MRDKASERWALAICVVVGLLLTSIAVRGSPDSLADRALDFVQDQPDGHYRLTRMARTCGGQEWIRETLVPLVEQYTAGAEWPTPEIVLAKSYWESRWCPRAVGAAEDHGLLQVIPRHARRYMERGERDADLLRPDVNLRVAIARLRDDYEACGHDAGRALSRYAVAQCVRPGWREKVVLGWAEQLGGE